MNAHGKDLGTNLNKKENESETDLSDKLQKPAI